ncbi:MAG: chemotaxis protein histidine kinase CheA/ActR/RegA family two-component response regulator [Cocleimonas sp.]|jgi:chemotaxis protein histidine kinase CheA/ActR/RegA family two-component response regulator
MQYNNKNESIANQLEIISQQIINEDKQNLNQALTTIQKAHNDIEEIALENEIPILRAIIHWMELNIELNDENEQQINSLLEDKCYSNWIEILSSILHKHDSKLLPSIHHSLTSPNWIIRPSAPLLTGLASWLAIVKIEHDSNSFFKTGKDELSKPKQEVLSDQIPLETQTGKDSETINKIVNNDAIGDQIAKAIEANEESLNHQNVFEEIDIEVLEKEYISNKSSTDKSDESSPAIINIIDIEETLLETEKSSLDDQHFEKNNISDLMYLDENILIDEEYEANQTKDIQSNSDLTIEDDLLAKNEMLVDSFTNKDNTTDLANSNEENIDQSIATDSDFESSSFENDFNNIINKLISTTTPTTDIFSANEKFIKELDNLILLTNESSLSAITPIAEWSKRNLQLFEENTTSKIQLFVSTGEVWSWISQIKNCLGGANPHSCLSDLTNCLTHEEWVEPIDTGELEALLICVKSEINGKHDNFLAPQENDEKIEINTTSDSVAVDEYPELLDEPNQIVSSVVIDNEDIDSNPQITSGFKMTWDDNTHPELLMVYLEETPRQIEELIPLLNLISNKQADENQKQIAARLSHTIKGGSAVVGITVLAELTNRLESLLDYSIKHKVSEDILNLLPKVGNCLESLLNAVQLQSKEPSEFIGIFNTLDTYVSTIDIDDVSNLELSTPLLPDFIQQQNNELKDVILDDTLFENDSSNSTNIIEDDLIDDELIEHDVIENNFVDDISANEDYLECELITDTDIHENVIEENVNKLVKDTDIDVQVDSLINIDTNEKEDEVMPTETSGFQLNWDDDTHPELLMVYLEETPSQINELVPLLHKISEGSANEDEKHVASRIAHTIKGASAIVGITTLSEFSYRLETLLDHSVKYQLPKEILGILPATALCLEHVFDAVQMQDKEPSNYFSLFKQLDHYVSNIEENDEPHELTAPVLPDFIVNQNKYREIIVEEESVETETIEVIDTSKQETTPENIKLEEVDVELDKSEVTDIVELDNECEVIPQDNNHIDTQTAHSESTLESTEITQVDESETKEEVKDIIVEIDSIVMNLITINKKSKNIKSNLDDYLTELQRFDLIVDISGYPELSLLSQWCQTNLELFANNSNDITNTFVNSGESWAWIEFVGATLNEPYDMSHMSSLSVELMRDDWAKSIEMDDLQTVLLALRNIEESNINIDAEYVVETTSDEVISWDKEVHPELLAVYFSETPDQINEVAELLHLISRGESNTEENKKAARIAHTIKGASGVVGLNSLVDLTHSLEDILDYSVNHKITNATAELLAEASDCMEGLFESIQNKQVAPEELSSVLKRLSEFSASLDDVSTSACAILNMESSKTKNQYLPSIDILDTDINIDEKNSASEQKRADKIDINEATIRVPVSVIDKLINLAGELVTTSSQVSDNLANTLATNKTIRTQDERVHNMLSELTNTIVEQENDQQNLISSLENSDFDSLEMDTYNELHSVVSLLSESISDGQEIDLTLNKQLNELTEKLRSLDKLNKDFSEVILSSRMVSINTIIPRLERIVRQTCRKTSKKAKLIVTGKDINIDTDILYGLVDPLLHMLRNSIDHGIETPEVRKNNDKDETGLIEISFIRDGNNIVMSLKDDGAGMDPEVIYQKAIHKDLITIDQVFSKNDTLKLILQPGFSTQENVTDISGRGVGMDVVNSSVENLKGALSIDSDVGEGTTFNLTIPVTLITNTTLLVKAADNTIAIPTEIIEQILYQEANSVITRDDTFFVLYEDQEIEIKSLSKLLKWPTQEIDFTKSYNVLIIKTDEDTHAIHIDSILSSREVVVKPLSPWVSSTKGIIGACHLTDGGVAPVIQLSTVLKQTKAESHWLSATERAQAKLSAKPVVTPNILVVDDSLSNRKALSLIIDKTDYDVITAVDGMDALRIMNENKIDLVFTDLEMPRMNGLELTQSIRAWSDKSKIPIVMITSRTTSKHRELAAKAGVDDYLTKPVVTETLIESMDRWLESKTLATAYNN